MRNVENTLNIRFLTDAELDAVSGGNVALAGIFFGWLVGKAIDGIVEGKESVLISQLQAAANG